MHLNKYPSLFFLSDKMTEYDVRSSPMINVVFGSGAIAEGITKLGIGDYEAAYDSFLAAAVSFVSGVVPFVIRGRGTSISSAASNAITGATSYLINKPSRSFTYNSLPTISLMGLGSNVLEDMIFDRSIKKYELEPISLKDTPLKSDLGYDELKTVPID